MKKIITLFSLSFVLISCYKNYPKPGIYEARFTGTYEIGGALSNEVESTIIQETTEESFYIGLSKINKCGKKVWGETGGIGNLAWVEIEGECDKKKGKYYITGTYRGSDYSGFIINGTFEIKSK